MEDRTQELGVIRVAIIIIILGFCIGILLLQSEIVKFAKRVKKEMEGFIM